MLINADVMKQLGLQLQSGGSDLQEESVNGEVVDEEATNIEFTDTLKQEPVAPLDMSSQTASEDDFAFDGSSDTSLSAVSLKAAVAAPGKDATLRAAAGPPLSSVLCPQTQSFTEGSSITKGSEVPWQGCHTEGDCCGIPDTEEGQ